MRVDTVKPKAAPEPVAPEPVAPEQAATVPAVAPQSATERRGDLERDMTAARAELAALHAERASLGATPGATGRRKALRAAIAEAEAEIADIGLAIAALRPALNAEHAARVHAIRVHCFERAAALLAHREAIAAWADATVLPLARELHRMAAIEHEARNLTRTHDAAWLITGASPADALLGALVKAEAIPFDRLPACYAMELHPAAAVQSLASDAAKLSASILSHWPKAPAERSAVQRPEAEAEPTPLRLLPAPEPFIWAAAPRVPPVAVP